MAGRSGTRALARAWTSSLIAAFAIVATLSLAGNAGAQEYFGFEDNSVSMQQTTASQAANFLAEEGSTSARLEISWDYVQHVQGAAFNFSTFDGIYNADLARGIRPLIVLTGAPAWASGQCPTGSTCAYPPATSHDADWQAFATAAAQRYPNAAGIEIWNEPNEAYAWAGGFDPARYTQLLKLAYTAIKAVRPSMPVIAGALAADTASAPSASAYPIQMFLQTMYDNGAKGYMDGISIHPYPNAWDFWYVYKAINVLEGIRDVNGDASTPVWISETGMSTTAGFTTIEQSEVVSHIIIPLLNYPGISGVYINQLVDTTTGPYENQGLGLLTVKLQPKPAFCAVSYVFGTGFKCPLLTVVPKPSGTQLGRWQAENYLQWASNAALQYYVANGSYTGVSSAALHAIDPRISATPADGTAAGSGADPTRIGVFPYTNTALLLCNASTADRSYCIATNFPSTWIYGMSGGSIYNAAYAVNHGASQTW